jgi:inner membrane protein YidH
MSGSGVSFGRSAGRIHEQEADVPDHAQVTKMDRDQISVDLSVTRTQMGANRTLMAWVRTSFSTITFGFTLYKILQALQTSGEALERENMPRNAGITLIVLALVALLMGALEYLRTIKMLERIHGTKLERSPSLFMAAFTGLIGLFLLFVILTRML